VGWRYCLYIRRMTTGRRRFGGAIISFKLISKYFNRLRFFLQRDFGGIEVLGSNKPPNEEESYQARRELPIGINLFIARQFNLTRDHSHKLSGYILRHPSTVQDRDSK